ncbi:MAG TPA: four helix bundle protein [Acidobacteriota bacterium]|nr:four helix bundle protein [Acidobacteriota bacterium]HND22398.1 four helix bundle protein [Acidobacteriota bacterium]HNG95980.1 four helix bundle protein [Acidobacteriota bacterium]HNH83613.1 four helix bundle protein [Acidobacteriota bacterium]HNJ39347.1 four helix bundle protein [Acidobacteriota bacterium]
MLQTYRDLEVWKKSIDLVESTYQLTKSFPAEEKFGLISQIQRAVVSIAANIAEGYGRKHRKEYLHHLSIAKGSLLEVETHLIIAIRLHFTTRDDAKSVWHLCQDVGRLLNKLVNSLNSKGLNPEP